VGVQMIEVVDKHQNISGWSWMLCTSYVCIWNKWPLTVCYYIIYTFMYLGVLAVY